MGARLMIGENSGGAVAPPFFQRFNETAGRVGRKRAERCIVRRAPTARHQRARAPFRAAAVLHTTPLQPQFTVPIVRTCFCAIAASLLTAQIASAALATPSHPAPTRIDVAPGVYVFQTPRYGDAGLDGNSVVVVGDDAVLVMDANGTPAAATAVLAELRKLTPKPVRYVVLSHWHWDHWYGAEVYRKAFPAAEIIGHERTKALMSGPAIVFNQPALDTQFPEHIKGVEAQLQRARHASPPDSTVAKLAEHAAADRWFLEQKRTASLTVPTRTFTDSLTLDLGGRIVKVLHHDRAITPGDAFLWLPAERIAVVADLLINPLTYGLFSYPSGWIRTLERIDALDAAVIVPGHGMPMRDEVRLHATIELLKRERAIVVELKAAGRTIPAARAAVLADSTVLALRETLTGGNDAYREPFALYLVTWVVPRIFQEIDGTLDDSIPAAP